MSQPPANPIEQRFQKLEAFWNEFIQDPDARILRWVADGDTLRMLDLFVELQNEEVATIPDLFIRLEVPFQDGPDYCFELIQSLVDQFREVRDVLREDGMNVDWSPPDPSAASAVATLVATLASFQQFYQSIMQHVAVVLVPTSLADQGAWQRWLIDLAGHSIPSTVRFFVVDHSTVPILAELAERFPKYVMSIDPALDMPGAYEELVEKAPGDGPAHDYRQLFVKLNNATSKGDLHSAEELAARATTIAVANNWPHLVTVAQMALGAAYFAAADMESTLRCYRSANAAIAESDDPAAPKPNLQTRMAEGSALIAAERFDEASAVFEASAGLAQAQGDSSAEMDCWRVAGWCHENCRRPDAAWECGEKSLTAAQAMDDAQRQQSTLAYTGQMLLGLKKAANFRRHKDQIVEQMVQLLGDDWESNLSRKGIV